MNVFINTEDYQHGRECIYQQLSGKSGRRILQLGKNPLVKNTSPIPPNVSWGCILYNIQIKVQYDWRQSIQLLIFWKLFSKMNKTASLVFLSSFSNMPWRGRALVKQRENLASSRFLSTLSRDLPRHSMFLKLDVCVTLLYPSLYMKCPWVWQTFLTHPNTPLSSPPPPSPRHPPSYIWAWLTDLTDCW